MVENKIMKRKQTVIREIINENALLSQQKPRDAVYLQDPTSE